MIGEHARRLINTGSAASSARTEGGRARALIALELSYMAFSRGELARLLNRSAAYRAGVLPPHLLEMSDPATLRGGPAGRFHRTRDRLSSFRRFSERLP